MTSAFSFSVASASMTFSSLSPSWNLRMAFTAMYLATRARIHAPARMRKALRILGTAMPIWVRMFWSTMEMVVSPRTSRAKMKNTRSRVQKRRISMIWAMRRLGFSPPSVSESRPRALPKRWSKSPVTRICRTTLAAILEKMYPMMRTTTARNSRITQAAPDPM